MIYEWYMTVLWVRLLWLLLSVEIAELRCPSVFNFRVCEEAALAGLTDKLSLTLSHSKARTLHLRPCTGPLGVQKRWRGAVWHIPKFTDVPLHFAGVEKQQATPWLKDRKSDCDHFQLLTPRFSTVLFCSAKKNILPVLRSARKNKPWSNAILWEYDCYRENKRTIRGESRKSENTDRGHFPQV